MPDSATAFASETIARIIVVICFSCRSRLIFNQGSLIAGHRKAMVIKMAQLAFLLYFFAMASGFAFGATHVLPDDTIHRNLQVVVKKDAIEVVVELGMNDHTIRQLGKKIDGKKDWSPSELELSRLFTKVAAAAVGRNLELLVDGERLPLVLISDEPAGKHHQTSRFVYRATVKSWNKKSQVTLADGNWTDLYGQARVAVKGKGVKLLDANAALLVVRAEPIELDELTSKERTEMLTIRAVVGPST